MNSGTDKQNPLVSVIIPLYNKASYIRRALDSVLAQTIQNFEIIVVGGKSSDGGEDIVKGYIDSRIRFIQETGDGPSAARNQGVAVAQADLIALLDADDEWLPKFLETILRLRENWPDGGIYSTAFCELIPGTSSRMNIRQKGICDGHDGPIQSIFKFAAINGGFPGCTSSIAIPKNIYIESNGFSIKYKYAEDLEYWTRLALYYPWIHSFENLVIYHRDDPNSMVKNPLLKSTDEHPFLQSFHTLFTLSEQQILLKSISDFDLYLESLNLCNAYNLLYFGQKKNALIELKKINHKKLKYKKMICYLKIILPNRLRPLLSMFKSILIKNTIYLKRLH